MNKEQFMRIVEEEMGSLYSTYSSFFDQVWAKRTSDAHVDEEKLRETIRALKQEILIWKGQSDE